MNNKHNFIHKLIVDSDGETNLYNKHNFIHKCLWIRKKVVSLQPERLKIEDYVYGRN